MHLLFSYRKYSKPTHRIEKTCNMSEYCQTTLEDKTNIEPRGRNNNNVTFAHTDDVDQSGRPLSLIIVMAKFGCPPRFIAMVRQFHDGMQARVQNDGEYSELFPVTNGVKQGCVMAPTLFNMMFSAMLTDAFQDVDAGFPIRYRFHDKLLNLRSLKCRQMW